MTVVNINDVKLSDAERQPCEIWTRVMGYLRPVSEFNKRQKIGILRQTVFHRSQGC